MGIRYYAYPVSPREIDDALRDPCRYHGDDPLMDAWGPLEDRPPMLYLDKCWSCLQSLFGLDSPDQRPAAELVRGDVTHAGLGWIPFERVLRPEQVAEIADDLEAYLIETDAQASVDCRFDGPADYVNKYLADARDFTREMVDAGYGLVYMIG